MWGIEMEIKFMHSRKVLQKLMQANPYNTQRNLLSIQFFFNFLHKLQVSYICGVFLVPLFYSV